MRHRRNPRHLFDVELPRRPRRVRARRTPSCRRPTWSRSPCRAARSPRWRPTSCRGPGAGPALLSMTKGLDPASGRRLSRDPRRARGRRPRGRPLGPQPRRGGGARPADRVGGGERERRAGAHAPAGAVGRGRCASTPPATSRASSCAPPSKNVIAIAAGVSDGLGYGDNAKAAIITRGMAEMSRLGEALRRAAADVHGHGRHGRSGGDLHVDPLAATGGRARCSRPASRRRGSSRRSARWPRGSPPPPCVRDVARERGIELPITEAVCGVAFGGVAPLDALAGLMAREPVEE